MKTYSIWMNPSRCDVYGGENRLGENIFYLDGYWVGNIRDNATIMVDDWMQSKGHRENILDTGYDKIGVGVKFDSSKIYATQNFC